MSSTLEPPQSDALTRALEYCPTRCVAFDRRGELRWANLAARVSMPLGATLEVALPGLDRSSEAMEHLWRELGSAPSVRRELGEERGRVTMTRFDDALVVAYIESTRALDEAHAQVNHLTEALTMARDLASTSARTRSSFLASMSHELRTPLNAIIGYTELVAEELEDEGMSAPMADLRKILTSAQHLLQLINDILDLSRIESDRLTLQWEEVDLQALVQQAVSAARPRIERHGNRLELDLQLTERTTLWADRARLHQALGNLLSNAAKFTSGGAVKVSLTRDDDALELSVSDNGIGIATHDLERIFEAFNPTQESTTRAYAGAGLGLALARHFCRLMGGELTAHSAPGQGSTFRMRLPDHHHSAPTPSQVSEAAATEHRARRAASGARVLVIDDDPQVHTALRALLAEDGVEVISAFDGMDGLQLARAKRPDIITLDVLMPGLNGWTVLASIKNDPELAEIPVIMLTMVSDRNTGYALGAADYLTKPFDRIRLLQTLGRYRREDHEALLLIVDDEPDLRDIFRRRAEGDGWRVLEAPDGQSALDALARHRPDVILLDLMMPTMDGFEFLDRLRQAPETRDLPVIVMTAMSLTEQDIQRLRGQAQQVVQKGGQPMESILNDIRRVLGRDD